MNPAMFSSPKLTPRGDEDETPTSPSGKTLLAQSEEIKELQKENFNLKLSIHYLQERLAKQSGGDGNMQEVMLENMNLKVLVEEKNQELEQRNVLLVKARNAIQSLHTQLSELRLQNSELAGQLSSNSSSNSDEEYNQQHLNNHQGEKGDRQQSISNPDALLERTRTMELNAQAANSQLERVQKENERLLGRVRVLETNAKHQSVGHKEIVEVRKEMERKDAQVTRLRREADELRLKLHEMSEQVDHFKDAKRDLSDQFAATDGTKSHVEEENDILKLRLAESREELDGFQIQNAQQTELLKQSNRQVVRLERELREKNNEILRLRSRDLDEFPGTSARELQLRKFHGSDILAVQREVASLQGKLTVLEGARNDAEQRLSATRRQLNEKEEEIKSLRDTLVGLREDSRSSNKELSKVRADLEVEVQKRILDAQRARQEHAEQIRRAVEEYRNEVSDARARLHVEQTSAQNLREEVSRLLARTSLLEAELVTGRNTSRRSSMSNEKIKAEHDEALAALHRAKDELEEEKRRLEKEKSPLENVQEQLIVALGNLAPKTDTNVSFDTLIQRVSEITNQLCAIQGNVEGKVRSVERDLTMRLDQEEDRLRSQEERLNMLSRAVSQLRKSSVEERGAQASTLESYDEQIKRLRRDNDMLRRRIDEHDSSNSSSEQNQNDRNSRLREQARRLGENNRVLIMEVQARGDEIAQTQKALASCEKKLLQTRSKLDRYVQRGKKYEAALKRKEERIKELLAKLHHSANAVHQLSAQKSQLTRTVLQQVRDTNEVVDAARELQASVNRKWGSAKKTGRVEKKLFVAESPSNASAFQNPQQQQMYVQTNFPPRGLAMNQNQNSSNLHNQYQGRGEMTRQTKTTPRQPISPRKLNLSHQQVGSFRQQENKNKHRKQPSSSHLAVDVDGGDVGLNSSKEQLAALHEGMLGKLSGLVNRLQTTADNLEKPAATSPIMKRFSQMR
eukprot:g2463.t1